MLPRLASLTVTNMFAALRLLPMSNRDKDAEILALRHHSPSFSDSSEQTGPSSLRRSGPSLPPYLRPCPVKFCAGSGYWSDPTPCCAGIAI